MLARVKEGATTLQLAEECGSTWAKYYKAADKYRAALKDDQAQQAAKGEFEDFVPRGWQLRAVEKLLAQDNRQVLWVVGARGNEVQGRGMRKVPEVTGNIGRHTCGPF